MNYDHLNLIQDFWKKEIFPFLSHNQHILSFEDYLRRFSYMPSGEWLRKLEKVKLERTIFLIDPTRFVQKYQDHCVTYNAPAKPEDGFQRLVYQVSPTLHLDCGLYLWVEQDVVQSHLTTFICYHDEVEYINLLENLYDMRREGNTEQRADPGFADLVRVMNTAKTS